MLRRKRNIFWVRFKYIFLLFLVIISITQLFQHRYFDALPWIMSVIFFIALIFPKNIKSDSKTKKIKRYMV